MHLEAHDVLPEPCSCIITLFALQVSRVKAAPALAEELWPTAEDKLLARAGLFQKFLLEELSARSGMYEECMLHIAAGSKTSDMLPPRLLDPLMQPSST